MLKSLINVSILLITGYGVLCLLVYFIQPKLIFFPTKTLYFTPKDIGLEYNDIWVKSENENINGWFIPAQDSKGAVLFCHGNGGNICHRLENIKIINSLSLSVLIFDYRGYGKSDGKPSEHNTYTDTKIFMDYMINTLKIPEEKIIIWGQSLGGAVAVELASKTHPGALILESTFSSIPDMASHLYPFIPAKWICSYKYDSFSRIKSVKVPKLFMHSKSDDIVPFELGLKLYNQASEPKTQAIIIGDHNNGFLDSGELYINAIKTFIETLKIN